MLIECHNCKIEFLAVENEFGECSNCSTKYDWYWQTYEDVDGFIEDDIYYIFETESSDVIRCFLGENHFKDEKFHI